MSNVIKGRFSERNSNVRHMYDASGALLGTITKLSDGTYRVYRLKDGKVRVKEYLEEAFKTIRRSN